MVAATYAGQQSVVDRQTLQTVFTPALKSVDIMNIVACLQEVLNLAAL